MEINLLALNLGNTRLAIGAFVGGELMTSLRVETASSREWAQKIAEVWERIKGRENAAIAGASVNPSLEGELERIIEETTGRSIAWVGQEIDVPIGVETDVPAETGIDRVLGIAAAFEEIEKACVVVDAGTAITVNVCNSNGDFLGGAIAPGVRMMLDALQEQTAKLPKVQFERPVGAIGTNTRQAILHGVFDGVRGMVKEIVENYATELGTWPEVVATGGDAQTLFEGWELIHAISPDLILYGIALAYAEHHIKHGS